jgi:hypothetical protein
MRRLPGCRYWALDVYQLKDLGEGENVGVGILLCICVTTELISLCTEQGIRANT